MRMQKGSKWENVTIATRKDQDIFGELSFLDENLVASATVVTNEPMEVYPFFEVVTFILLIMIYIRVRFQLHAHNIKRVQRDSSQIL